MNTNTDQPEQQATDFRKRAEDIAREKTAQPPENQENLSPEEARMMLHELQVHQIELEIQNEELRKAHVHLDASRARYFDLFNLAPVGYITISEKGLILETNLTAASLLGVPRGYLAGQPLSKFILKEDQNIYYLHRKKLVETGEPQKFELRMINNDRAEFWSRLEAIVTQNAEGAPVYRVVLSDITEQRKTEDALRESEARLAFVLEGSQSGYWDWDVISGKVKRNRRCAEILGYGPEEINVVVRQWKDLIHPDDRAAAWNSIRGHLSGESPAHRIKYRMLTKGRQYKWILDQAGIVERDTQGRPTRMSGTLTDINDYMLAEKRVLESEEKYRALVEKTSDWIWEIDAKGVFTFSNPKIKDLLGYDPEELIGKTPFDFMAPEEAKRVFDFFRKQAKSGSPIKEFENTAIHKNGRAVVLETSGTPFFDDEGNLLGYRGMNRDITQRKRAAQAINRALSQSRQRAVEVSALLEGARIVLDYADFGQAAPKIFDICCSVTGATAGYTALLSADENQNEILFLKSGDLPRRVDPALPLSIRGLREIANRLSETVLENDFPNSEWIAYMPGGHCRLDNVLFSPITINGEVQGILGLANKPIGFTENDQRLVSAFTELIAVSLRNSRMLEALEEKEKRLQDAHNKMEQQVKERTRELLRSNQQLVAEMEERKRATAALQESRERYRRITDSITDAIYTVHMKNDAPVGTKYSPAYQAVIGYSPEEIVEDPGLLLRMVEEPHREAVQAFSQELLTRGVRRPSIEYQIVRKDGKRCWIRNTLVPFYDYKGNLLYYDGLLQDITDLKHSELQILQSKKMLQAVFDAISDPLILVDHNLTIEMLNSAAVRYYRMDSPRDLIGKSGCMEFCAKRERPDRCLLNSFISEENKEMYFERAGCINPERIEAVTLFPVAGEKEEDSGTVIRVSDITEARMVEKAMIRSQKLASIGVLSSGIAHEINNPNNFIMFNIPVLRRYHGAMLPLVKEQLSVHVGSALFGMSFEEFERDLFQLTDSIETGSERIKTIVNELKDFSYLGDQTETASGNPAQTITQAVRISRVQLKGKVNRLDIDIPKGLPNAFFEAKGLEQVIVNILINAAHATDKQDSWVRLKAKIEGRDKRYFVIEIADNGCGMEANVLKKIFDPFFTTKPPGQGTGLGLYVCHNLIEKMGGHMDVESRIGEGSTFRIMLRCE